MANTLIVALLDGRPGAHLGIAGRPHLELLQAYIHAVERDLVRVVQHIANELVV